MQRVDEGPISADLSRYLQGVQFPILKHDVLQALRHNGAPDLVVARAHTLEQTEFASLEQLEAIYQEAREYDPSPNVPKPGKTGR